MSMYTLTLMNLSKDTGPIENYPCYSHRKLAKLYDSLNEATKRLFFVMFSFGEIV